MWDPTLFTKTAVSKDRNFLLVSENVIGHSTPFHIVNVYATQGNLAKRDLWQKPVNIRGTNQGYWIFFGDFNVVRSFDDRKNSGFYQAEAIVFNDFIHSADLYEFPMKGRKFTFYKVNGSNPKHNKIDRFLVCHRFLEDWSDACLLALPRYLSGHSPLILAINPIDFGPKPFRFFNSCLDKDGFGEVVKSACDSFIGGGVADLNLSNKLKFLKQALKVWFSESKAWDEELKDNLCSELFSLDAILENRDLAEEESWVYAECKAALFDLDSNKIKDIKQRSCANWASFGDDNCDNYAL
ncbi:uncharacterized protein LOC110943242 [Helianthus annuus]|uniref:uncharacterized protein LOC110943242 n=1 Tax=Helianthus annuus TaxID=4232 RepID=UPI000B8F873B|nr:uncharacterized protein LOC110943242 [Helianthus annuus]